MRRLGIFWLFILCFFMAACSQETDLFLRSQEQWELTSVVSLNLDLLPSIGGEIEGFSLELDPGAMSASALEFTLDQMVAYLQTRGMEASWQKTAGQTTDETGYLLTMQGQGWNMLSQLSTPDPALLSILEEAGIPSWPFGIAVVEGETGQLHFTMDSPEGMALVGALFPMTFRLHGGEIISSNADVVEGGVATWYNPEGRLEAVVTPATAWASGSTLAWIVGGILLLGGGIALVIWLVTRRSAPVHAGRGVRPSLRRSPPRRVPTRRPR